MKKFVVATKDNHEVVFNFPTSVNEISENYLNEITKALNIADNYSLIALCYSEKLSDMIFTARANKNAKIKITPIFVKAGNTDVDFIKNAKMKQRIVTMQSQLSLGIHVTLPHHRLSIDYFANVVKNAADKNLYEKELASEDKSECVFIEFKVIPNSDIAGLLDMNTPAIEDNYVAVKTIAK